MLIADKTGASVIIGVKDSKLSFDRSSSSRGFGYGNKVLTKMLQPAISPSIENGLPILNACIQEGEYGTKYSNVFDLKTGDVSLISFGGNREVVKLNLKNELEKGGHYYELPQITSQLNGPILPLLPSMHRFLSDAYPELKVDPTPSFTNKVRRLLNSKSGDVFQQADFSPEFWKIIAPELSTIHKELTNLGEFNGLRLVEASNEAKRTRLYLIEFTFRTILTRYTLDESGRISSMKNESFE